ncbi:type II toxin-antitoxin system PemK/MazF family toxin [Actinotalea sp.]|uniref:type II toxin-antitoxin system PemK/MazF family toxin n=1 Tax=Actinotalea sp. TaxID=1872145 RepID=UPI002C428A5D|nr:type II toxin-antitoxin system PemK/MazF family toxin [Actinotalea sp.]HQY33334.1 type II toxin-antitoxin system PemK/MazF family toxin [Actinotalea sp.]HRA50954.1 type II toxin-antitoxin system PemK/MazF family toxin [Actinotalea sp.]
MSSSPWIRLLDSVLRSFSRPAGRPAGSAPAPRPSSTTAARPVPGAYPGDFTGTPRAVYAPRPDGDPDPGEIVWTWVPYEEDHTQGKDRPVLLVGRDGPWLLGLMLSTRDHDVRPAPGDTWVDIGVGAWDRQGRPSEVRVDRVVRVDPAAVRREGAVLGRAVFDEVARSLAAARG